MRFRDWGLKNKGFTVAELLIATAITFIAVTAALVATGTIGNTQKYFDSSAGAYAIKMNLLNNLISQASWNETIAKNATMQCLVPPGSDCSALVQTGASFALYDQKGNLVYDPNANNNQASGFTQGGALCSTYDAVNGNGACPFRYTLTWYPLCPPGGGQCLRPEVKVVGAFSYQYPPGITTHLNPQNFSISALITPPDVAPPVLGVETVYTNENQAVTLNPLANSYSDPSNPLKVTTVSQPLHGQTTLNGDGSITYTPSPGNAAAQISAFYGLDSFTFTVKSAMGQLATSTAWVKVMTPYTWTNASGDNNWNNPLNWCGTVAQGACAGASVPPAASSVVVFDDTCSGGCSPTITSNIVVKAIFMNPGYNGTITQSPSATITIEGPGYGVSNWSQAYGNLGFYQAGGKFVGSNNSINIVYGQFELDSGANFTSTSGMLVDENADFYVKPGATFNNNNGTIDFGTYFATGAPTIVPGTVQYNNVAFKDSNGDHLIAGKMLVNNLTVADSALNNYYGGPTAWSSALNPPATLYGQPYSGPSEIDVSGNVNVATWGASGSTVIKMTGSGTLDASNTTPGIGCLGSVEIAAGSGTVRLVGNIVMCHGGAVTQNIWKYTSGNVIAGTSTLTFGSTAANSIGYSGVIVPGPVNYNNVVFNLAFRLDYTIVGTLNVMGSLTLNTRSAGDLYESGLFGGTIAANGDVIVTNNGARGNTNVELVGSGTQNVNATNAGTPARLPSLTIASGGAVDFTGSVWIGDNFTYTSGSVNWDPSGTLHFNPDINSGVTVSPGSLEFENVSFDGWTGGSSITTLAATMTVNGTLTLDCGTNNGITGSPLVADGDVILLNQGMAQSYEGTSVLQIAGNGNQKIDATGASNAFIPALTIESTGTVSILGTMTETGNFTYTSGTVSADPASVFNFNGYSLSANFGSGLTLANVGFLSGYTETLTGTLTVSGDLTLGNSGTSQPLSIGQINGGMVKLTGPELLVTQNGQSGTTTLSVTGSNQMLDASSATSGWNIPHLSVTGTLSLAANVSNFPAESSMDLLAGQLNLNGKTFATSSLTLSSGTSISLANGTLTVAGNTISPGPYSGGTVLP